MKNFIWDFDGTIFDSYPHTTAAFIKALGARAEHVDADEIKSTLEESIILAIEKYGLSERETELFFEYEYDYDFSPLTKPYKETKIILEKISGCGKNNYLYTHRNASVFYYLDKYNMRDYFSDFITKENSFPMKPSPDALNDLIEKYELDKNETIMIGDRDIDVSAGKNAGIHSLLISGKISESCADYIVKNTSELLRFIEKILP